MRELLIKLKLIDFQAIHLNIDKGLFISRLNNITAESELGFFSNGIHMFSSNKNIFKGKISQEGFKLKMKSSYTDSSNNMPIVFGTFSESNKQLTAHIEIHGFNSHIKLLYFLITLYHIFNFYFLFMWKSKEEVFLRFFSILFALLVYLVPFFMMRSSVKNMKHTLEREFFFLTKD